jgi:predicted TPR repeat methyltransferase
VHRRLQLIRFFILDRNDFGGRADFLFAFDVLQYVEDWASLFSTVDRILKPSGLLHIYPAEIPHPDEVDTAKLTALLETLGFEAAAAEE